MLHTLGMTMMCALEFTQPCVRVYNTMLHTWGMTMTLCALEFTQPCVRHNATHLWYDHDVVYLGVHSPVYETMLHTWGMSTTALQLTKSLCVEQCTDLGYVC